MIEFSVDDSAAIKALGPLFKLTEVHLWDDGLSEVPETSYFQEPSKIIDGNHDHGNCNSTMINGFSSLTQDVDLAKELIDLGLPLSFHTNKEKRHGMLGGKRKGARKNSLPSSMESDNSVLDSTKASKEENESPASLLNASRKQDQIESLKHGIVVYADGLSKLSLEWSDSTSSTAGTSSLSNGCSPDGEVSHLGLDHSFSSPSRSLMVTSDLCVDDGASPGSCLAYEDGKSLKGEMETSPMVALSVLARETEARTNDPSVEIIQEGDFPSESQFLEKATSDGDWITCWDDIHMRIYYYNFRTWESSWDLPSEMKHQGFGYVPDEPANMGLELDNNQLGFGKPDEVEASHFLQTDMNLSVESGVDNGSLSLQYDEDVQSWLSADSVSAKRKKKVRRTKCRRKLSISTEELRGVLLEVPPSISKYWCQRYLLFSRFDDGIKMDEEGWFSVTPESIAKHIAVRCGTGAIVDFFTGVGGNAIQFAQRSKHVVAIDIDPNKIDYARHNAALYGVDDNIDFVRGDSFSLAPKMKADTVFMSPPWGGPDYTKVKKFDINTMLKPHDGQHLFNIGRRIASKIVMFLPRNVDLNQLAELSLSATPPWSLEVEKNFLNDRLKAVTAYFCEPSVS